MSVRHVAKAVGISSAIACAGALSAVSLAGVAGAAAPTNGSQVGSATPSGSFTPGLPFSSGQTITINVPPNTVLPGDTNVLIEECAAPNGVIPTLTAQCDSNTVDADTITPNSDGPGDGSFTYSTYQVYALPDTAIGDTATSNIHCGNTVATECVLYIGDNVNDFTAPHFWSQPFLTASYGNDRGSNPGDGTPEFPLAVGLPLAAAGIMGGLVLRRRRVSRRAA